MSGFAKALMLLVAFFVAAYGYYKWNYPSYSWRQRVTVTVATPHGEASGSSVAMVEWRKNVFSGGWGGALYHLTLRGEATAVDLGDGQVLFALLGRPDEPEYAGYLALRLFGGAGERPSDGPWSPAAFAAVRGARGAGPKALPEKLYPLLVRFRDIADPKTVERVDPNDLAKSFGPGVKLVRATIEITDEPVTVGIEKRLGWLLRIKGSYLDGQFAGGGPALSNILHGGNFKSQGIE